VSIGEALAEARRRAGLTVTQVSDQTGIREMIITGIESDDYSACGGDLYVRGYIRGIAQAVGADPEPLIAEYNTAQPAPQAITDNAAAPVTFTKTGERLWRAWFALVALVVAGLWFVTFHSLAGSHHATGAAPSARAHPVTHSPTGHGSQPPSAAPKTTTPGAAAVRTLTPASAAAFNPYGSGNGDHPGLAHLAIDGNPATAWHTDWYTSAQFGNLYPGTGLLVDMGRPATITAARITLGSTHGAGFQLRVGAAPTLADLPPVAHSASTGGVVRLRLTTPAHGRYVLIWFTSLPQDPAGTFQASVYNLRLEGPP
jgi:transcriptional regulator with XRE-family HTH domain